MNMKATNKKGIKLMNIRNITWFMYMTITTICLLAGTRDAYGYAATVNKADYTEIHVVPAPGKVVIDGDLVDWDRSGAIFMFVDNASRETHSARVAMMYDKEFLYIGGVFRDPTPMRNAHAFSGDPGMAWDADALQVRLLTNPALKSSASMQTGSRMPPEDQHFLNHITLWYSSQDKKPGYFAMYTLGFKDPTLNPAGVEGVYKQDADGKGYTFEYRVSWAVVRAPQSLQGGDEIQAQFQVNWGNDLGTTLRTSMTDLRNPGSNDLGYMGPSSWGKAVFERTGNLKLTEKPAVTDRAVGHIPIAFTLDKASKVSLAILSGDGKLVRTCLGAQPYPAGKHTYLWDGLDDSDRPLPVGTYKARILTHDGIKQKFVCDIGVSGTPPYQTEDGIGGWAGDYRYPQTMGIEGDSVILGTAIAEAAAATICTDLEGRKRYGTAAVGHAVALHQGFGYMLGAGTARLTKFDLATGRLAPFTTGRSEVMVAAPNPVAVAVAGDRLVVSSLAVDGRLILFDLASGEVRGEAPIDKPRGLAVGPKGELYVLSDKFLGRYDLAANRFEPITEELNAPQHIACDADGNLYVSLQGQTMQVWKISPAGKVLQKFGKAGGRPLLGTFDPAGMLNPYGIAVDKNGRLWVAEADPKPKRYSVWNPDGTLWKEFFGSMDYSTQAVCDPEKPEVVYMQGIRYLVDYEQGTWKVDATLMRAGVDDGVDLAGQGNHNGGYIVVVKGRRFFWTGNTLWELDGDKAVPRMSFFVGKRVETPIGRNGKPGKPKEVKVKQLWIDTNNDGRVQTEEKRDAIMVPGYFLGLPMDRNLNLYWATGNGWASQGGTKTTVPYSVVRWKFQGFNEQGGLTYGDPGQPEIIATDADGGAYTPPPSPASDGSIYVLVSGGSLDRGVRAQGSGHRVVKFSPQGQKLWEYHNVHCAFAWTSEPYTPGYIVSAFVMQPSLEDIALVTGYYGQYFLLDAKEGLFLEALGQDQRSPYKLDQTMVLTETFNGTLVRHPKTGKTYVFGGDCDQRVWELTGLDSIKRSSVNVSVTDAMVAQAQKNTEQNRQAQAGVLARNSGRNAANLQRFAGAAVDGKDGEWQGVALLPIGDAKERPAQVQIGYDDQNLYARFEVKSAVPFLNTPTDYRLLFKSGSALELCLTPHLGARPVTAGNRHPMQVGDLRVLIARTKDGKLIATRYRPKIVDKQKPLAYFVETPASGREDFDEISEWNDLPMHYREIIGGYVVEVAVPWSATAIKPQSGLKFLFDAGVITGNEGGTRNAVRALWSDRTPEVGVNNDIPTESRLHPNGWGVVMVE
jgi:hypothetical protein